MSDEIEKAIKNAASELASDPAHIPQIQWVMRKHLALIKSQLTQERDEMKFALYMKSEAMRALVARHVELIKAVQNKEEIPIGSLDTIKLVASANSPTIGADLMRELERYKTALEKLQDGEHTGTRINKGCGAMFVIEEALTPKEPTE